MQSQTIRDLLLQRAEQSGDAPAILAPGRDSLSFADLARHMERVARGLRAAGIRPTDRVAIVLPNGPDLATAFLSVASAAASAPLNPALTQDHFVFALRDLDARALVIREGQQGPACDAARELGIPMLPIRTLRQAGAFKLPGDASSEIDWPDAEATALLLHTSGSTARPKLVPLSARNLTASATHISAALALNAGDRCLNIMPLFHIHGLMACVLASVHAGAGVVCTDGIYAARFFEWVREYRPTWYSAVPTMHQTILAQARLHPEAAGAASFRFIRSSSAPLPVSVFDELECVFGAPVIEAYGMTEASHQMASSPLPPRPRKPGSVGVPAGAEIAIMAADGSLLPPGEIGEIVIRGPGVTAGYEGNEAATRQAFEYGWFHTGDQGRLDHDGYLFLTGRLKELINRGGEKIAPRSVEDVLLAHPDVRQAVCFAVPHVQLGEDVGVAVELQPDSRIGADDLRRFAASRLPAFCVPRVVRIVDRIPTGPTGKLRRIGLAEALGVDPLNDAKPAADHVAPRTELEARIAAIWRKMLPGARVGVHDRFEALGGDSLLAATMLVAVSEAEGVSVASSRFVEEGTIASLAADIMAAPATGSPLVELRKGQGRPIYWLPGHDGSLLGIARVAQAFAGGPPTWAVDLKRLSRVSSVDELAAQCVSFLCATDPGPYRIGGMCFGGIVAFEVARQLQAAGRDVEFLALVDAVHPRWHTHTGWTGVVGAWAKQAGTKVAGHAAALRRLGPSAALAYVAVRARAFVRHHGQMTAARLRLQSDPGTANRGLALRYDGGVYDGPALVVRVPGRRPETPALGWGAVVRGQLEVVDLPVHFRSATATENLPTLIEALRSRLG